MTAARRSIVAVSVVWACLFSAACTSDKDGSASTSTTTKHSTNAKANRDDVFTLRSDTDAVTFRGGVTSAADLHAVSASEPVKTPMDVTVSKTLDSKLAPRSRNQLRTIIARATDDRGDVPRADIMRVQPTPNGGIGLFVVIDNPTDQAIGTLQVTAELLEDGTTSAGKANFVIPESEIADIPANSAVVTLLTVGKDRLSDETPPVDQLGVRLDLRFAPAT